MSWKDVESISMVVLNFLVYYKFGMLCALSLVTGWLLSMFFSAVAKYEK